MQSIIRKLLFRFVQVIFFFLAEVRVEGLENVPRYGGAILAPNHLSRLDSPLMFQIIRRSDLTGLVGDSYKKYWIMRWLVAAVGGIWINRQEADLQALKTATEFLQSGGLLGIAPEGTRSRTGGLIPAKTGVAYLANKARVPVIPIAITGTEDALKKLSHFHRPKIKVVFGSVLVLEPLVRGSRSDSLQRNTDEIMCQIAALLPEKYHGVYKENPRVIEILANQA